MSAPRKKSSRRARPAAARPAAAVAFGAAEASLARLVPDAGAPAARVKAALLARIRASVTAAAGAPAPGWRFESAGAADGWRATAFPGVRFKTLSVDEARDTANVLVELAPGARFPDHRHDDGPDEGIVLSGDVVNGGRLMRAGDYYYAAHGTVHAGTVSSGGCVALITLTARAWHKWRVAAEGAAP